jgi:hypothetical protein
MSSLQQEHNAILSEIEGQVVGLNVGNGFVKGTNGAARLPVIPSVVSVMNEMVEYEENYSPDDILIEYQGVRYAVGYTTHRLGSAAVPDMSGERMMSSDYLILFLAALSLLDPGDKRRNGDFVPARVVLVAPLSSYNRNRKQIKKYLAGSHQVGVIQSGRLRRTVTIHISEDMLKIIPEGRGTLASLTLTDEGLPVDPDGYSTRTVGIVQVGTRTTEGLFYERSLPNDSRSWGLSKVGLSTAWKHLQDYARNRHNFELDMYQADEALKAGGFYIGKKWIDLGEEERKDSFIANVARQVGNELATRWQNGEDTYHLLLSGGGTEDVYPYLRQRFPHLTRVKDPVYAEAVGAWKYGLFSVLNEMGIIKRYVDEQQ